MRSKIMKQNYDMNFRCICSNAVYILDLSVKSDQ